MNSANISKTIRISGEALLSVINDILDFSKIESERMEFENTDFNLYSLIQNTVDMMIAQVQRKVLHWVSLSSLKCRSG